MFQKLVGVCKIAHPWNRMCSDPSRNRVKNFLGGFKGIFVCISLFENVKCLGDVRGMIFVELFAVVCFIALSTMYKLSNVIKSNFKHITIIGPK